MRLAASIIQWCNGVVSGAVQLFAEMRASEQKAVSLPPKYTSAALAADRDIVLFRLSDVGSFAALALAKSAFDLMGDRQKAFIIDFADVHFIDRIEAGVVASVISRANHQGIAMIVSGVRPSVRLALADAGTEASAADFCVDLRESLATGRIRVLERQVLATRRAYRFPFSPN